MTTGKTIVLTICPFVSKLMSLLFNILSRFVIAFHPRSKRLLISWLQSPSAAILEPPKNKMSLLPVFPLLFAMKIEGTRCHAIKTPSLFEECMVDSTDIFII